MHWAHFPPQEPVLMGSEYTAASYCLWLGRLEEPHTARVDYNITCSLLTGDGFRLSHKFKTGEEILCLNNLKAVCEAHAERYLI